MDTTLTAKIKNILIIIGAILLALSVFKCTKSHYEYKLNEKKEELRREVIKSSKLEKVAEGHYKKLVADTLKIKQLEGLIAILNIPTKGSPRIVEKVVMEPIYIEKPIYNVKFTDSIVYTTDYYPDEQKPFLKYSSEINLSSKNSVGKFKFYEIPISIVVSENEDGTFTTDLKAPEFISIKDFDFQSLPLDSPKIDNFGWLVGGGYFKDIARQEQGIEITGGLRYKDWYLLGSAQTNSTVGLKVLTEF